LSPGQFLFVGIFNFKESKKLKEDSLSGSGPPYLFIYMIIPPIFLFSLLVKNKGKLHLMTHLCTENEFIQFELTRVGQQEGKPSCLPVAFRKSEEHF